MEVGARFRWLMPHISLDGGGGKDHIRTLESQLEVGPGTITRARTSVFGVGAGLSVFIKASGRADPYLTVRLGYTRVRSRFRIWNGRQFAETVYRGSLRLGGGVDVFVSRYLALGPRFDVTIGFRGRVCITDEVENFTQECYATRNLHETVRVDPSDLPIPVFVGAQARIIIPWPA